MKRLLLLLSLALIVPAQLVMPSAASAHYGSCDSVDGREIRWTSNTALTSQRDYAIAQWNALGAINIAPDTASTSADLRFEDVARPDKTWLGLYSCRWARIDLIKFNLSNLIFYTDNDIKSVALHELGHALRLGHSFPGQVMGPSLQVPPVITIQSHDRADYCAQWGCPGSTTTGSVGRTNTREVLP